MPKRIWLPEDLAWKWAAGPNNAVFVVWEHCAPQLLHQFDWFSKCRSSQEITGSLIPSADATYCWVSDLKGIMAKLWPCV